jgi:hypothetical protein
MTNSVTFPINYGGDGSIVTDDSSPTTGLGNGGHRLRFIPSLSNMVAMVSYAVSQIATAVNYAAAAAASAASALGYQTGAQNAATLAQGYATQAAQTSLGASTALPTIKPTLNLSFAQSEAVPSVVEFLRNTTATVMTNQAVIGDQNLLTYSSQITVGSVAWLINGGTPTADTATAPDGTMTADSLTETDFRRCH